ncbi:hypothetical protein BJP36_38215 [Moorena producens JHB]|uniref:Uncharacterized protein n=1 Tax=Moorena producens (strain JHB) TaxID=1454205 RepID=A0A9Q9SUL2_MOOP1|nr:hypothetical protein BJP36_38215 [Moorena producens JHB]
MGRASPRRSRSDLEVNLVYRCGRFKTALPPWPMATLRERINREVNLWIYF